MYDKYNETLEYEVYKLNQELEKVKNSSDAEIKFNYGVVVDKSALIESLVSNVKEYESILEENKIKKEKKGPILNVKKIFIIQKRKVFFLMKGRIF